MRKFKISKLVILLVLFTSSYSFSYQYQVSATMVFQDEAPYLKEWIEYHKLIGVEHFYLYNNGSVDNYREVLSPYIEKNEVELFYRPSTDKLIEFDRLQRNIYKDAIQKSHGKTKWLLIIDSDEFVVPVIENNISDFLNNYENESIGGVFLSWIWFGTSYVQKIPDDCLMIELLHLNKGPVPQGKSIVRPERVKSIGCPHRHNYKDGFFCESIKTDEAQINHYWCRDEYYAYKYKWPRRQKWGMSIKDFEIWVNDGNRENPGYFEPIIKYIQPLRNQIFSQMDR